MLLPVAKGTTAGQSCSGKVQRDQKKKKFSPERSERVGSFGLHSYDVDPVWQANMSLLGCLGLDPKGGFYLLWMRPFTSPDISVILLCPCFCGRGVRKKQLVTVENQILDTQITSCDGTVPGLCAQRDKNSQGVIVTYL